MKNRTDKIRLLEKIFSENDISSLADANKKYSIALDIRQDKGLQRQETATFGNSLTLWNYADDEAEKIRKKLKTEYEIVWVTEYETV